MYVADYTDDACLGEIDLEYIKYIAEGRLIRICPKKLEAKDLKDNLMRNRRLFVFIIGLEILLQNMANNVCHSVLNRCEECCNVGREHFEHLRD